MDISADLIDSHTGYDVTSYFRSAFIGVENTASDGFVSNFNGAGFCLSHQLVGFLFIFANVFFYDNNELIN